MIDYRQILDSMATGIFTVDTDWRITFFNHQAEKITGFSRAEALGHTCYEIFRSELCYHRCYLKRAMESGRNFVRVKIKILDKRNREIPVEITAAVLRDGEGNIVGGVESFQDISAHLALEKKIKASYTFEDIIGKDKKMTGLFAVLPVIAESDVHVLLLGETGTGKDLLARALHNLSHRKKGPFIKVNCAALPDQLLESELFGYMKGAFTDARQNKPGRFQLAQGGTIFLDEIGDLSQELQAKLLQVLEEKEFYPLGSTHPLRVDTRIISSTNRDLTRMVQDESFREDLYYRLKVLELELPPLRERPSDIPLLIEHFITEYAQSQSKDIQGVEPDAMEILLNYSYPGNVREINNIIEHAVILARDDTVRREDLPAYLFKDRGFLRPAAQIPSIQPSADPLAAKEREAILEALKVHGWNIGETARSLHVHRTTLWRKIRRYGLSSKQ
ncbi:MAG: sigma 54-interacting transcriptional regulator [Deltaproteobacteria bacterium]|nr:sigma 54-interacting transcriptional regulator [Deltaproteobacteria bacterium]MBW2308781.1 sigma 54-interacting transcriptional regulator [Deltaproteobacteria bacterium]